VLFLKNDMSFEDMVRALSFVKGVDVANFDRVGRQSLRHLHSQLMRKDLIAVILTRNQPQSRSESVEEMTRAIRRFLVGKGSGGFVPGVMASWVTEEMVGRLLVVRMTVKIHVRCPGFELLEVRRIFTTDGKREVVEEQKNCANTETRIREGLFLVRGELIRRPESTLECACRAAREELDLDVGPEAFEEDLSEEMIGEIHESSVYPGVLSQQVFRSVTLRLPERLWPDGRTYEDDGVEIEQKWFPEK